MGLAQLLVVPGVETVLPLVRQHHLPFARAAVTVATAITAGNNARLVAVQVATATAGASRRERQTASKRAALRWRKGPLVRTSTFGPMPPL